MYYPKIFWPAVLRVNDYNQKTAINTDEAKLRTFPKNALNVSEFFGSRQIHHMGENSKALVFGITGETLEADLSVGFGHQHNTQQSRLRWLQLATFPFVNSSISGDDIEDAFCIRSTGLTKRACVKLTVPFADATHVIPRIKISVAPAPSATVNLNLLLNWRNHSNGTLLYAQPLLNLSTFQALDRQWFECQPIDIMAIGAQPDENNPIFVAYAILAELTSTLSANTEFFYIHELSFGVYDQT
jgi:hypothetical protein